MWPSQNIRTLRTKTGELQRFMYFHYSSQCEAKCAFLALRIYCWRLRTKIVSLIIRNPTTPLTLKPWSSSHHHLALQSRTFATTDQQWGQYLFEVVFEFKKNYPQNVPLLLKIFYFSTVSETPQKKDSRRCMFIGSLL